MLRAALAAALLRLAEAVLVGSDSPCRVKCGNELQRTPTSDITCNEDAGTVWQNCLECELTSHYHSVVGGSNQTDLQIALYNMRLAMDWCVFGEPDNEHVTGDLGPCRTTTSCGAFKDAIEYGDLAQNGSAYGYCSAWDNMHMNVCGECLVTAEGGHYLRNYMNVLDGACRLQPSPGLTLSLDGDVFSSYNVSVSAPTASAGLESSGPSGPLSLGAIVGVVIGGVVGLLALAGCCIVTMGKRRRKEYLRRREEQMKHWPTPQMGGGEMFETPTSQRPLRGWDETPVSQRPLRGWDESPVSAATDHAYPQYYSPYSSQYNSPVSAAEVPRQMPWPIEKAQSIGVALSPDREQSEDHWGDRKGKDKAAREREEYELQEGVNSGGGFGHGYVPPPPPSKAPVLGHPGYGRSPPRSVDLTEDDFASGRAI